MKNLNSSRIKKSAFLRTLRVSLALFVTCSFFAGCAGTPAYTEYAPVTNHSDLAITHSEHKQKWGFGQEVVAVDRCLIERDDQGNITKVTLVKSDASTGVASAQAIFQAIVSSAAQNALLGYVFSWFPAATNVTVKSTAAAAPAK